MHLLDFEHFDLVRELLKNRLTIVWCTRLQRAQADDERQRIEAGPRLSSLHAHSCHLCRKVAPAQAECGNWILWRTVTSIWLRVVYDVFVMMPELPLNCATD